MSAIVGVFTVAGALPSDHVVHAMLRAMRGRGADVTAVWRDERALLGVARHDWEMAPGFSGDARVVADADLAVVADASVYYRDDLRRAVRAAGVVPAGTSASHLISAAYRAWGDAAAERLEGDFAYVIWDRARHRISAARDFGGKRTLFHASLGGGNALVIASTVGGVLACPGCPDALDVSEIGATAAGFFAASEDTCYGAIKRLPAGFTLVRELVREPGVAVRVVRHWSPPPVREDASLSFENAAEELRRLLEHAVRERMVTDARTSIWLSGGWDSPAVFGAGQAVLRAHGGTAKLLPVSMSYPEGDPGREDEYIRSIGDHWQIPVHWLDIRDVLLLGHARESAARRDEPFAHAFELWLRALARGSRAVGARVALDGMGGDQLFQVSEVYLADLLRGGRLVELAREARAKGMRQRGYREFFRWAVQPLLPHTALALAARVRGGVPLTGYLEPAIPEWISPEFARAHRLVERERDGTPMQGRGNSAAYETHWYLSHPYFPRVYGCVAEVALEEGVEVRSPLYDRRIIDFATRRPRWERSSRTGTKLLLRHAVRNLLPASVLAPRAQRTGGTSAFFARSMRAEAGPILDDLLPDLSRTAAGMIDAEKLASAWHRYLAGSGRMPAATFLSTVQTVLWLRERAANGSAEPDGPGSRAG